MPLTRPVCRLLLSILLPLMAAPLEAQVADKRGTFYGAIATVYPDWFKESFLDLEEDVAEATDEGKRLLLIFQQDRCPYCNILVERNLSQRDIAELMQNEFQVIGLNIAGDRELRHVDGGEFTAKTFAKTLGVQFTPTVLFLDESGATVLRLNGYLPPREFKLALEYVSQHREAKGSYRDFLAANVPKSTGGDLRGEPFFATPPHNLSRAADGEAPPLAVFFEQRDCPACETLHERILIDPDIRAQLKDFEAIQLDMWSDTAIITPGGEKATARQWADSLKVRYAPTVILFDRQGREVIRAESMLRMFHMHALFAYVGSGSQETFPSFQRYLSDRSHGMLEAGQDVDIWRYADEPVGQR